MSTASSTSNITSKAIYATQRAAENSIRRYLCLEAKYSALGLSVVAIQSRCYLLQRVRKSIVLASSVKDIEVRYAYMHLPERIRIWVEDRNGKMHFY